MVVSFDAGGPTLHWSFYPTNEFAAALEGVAEDTLVAVALKLSQVESRPSYVQESTATQAVPNAVVLDQRKRVIGVSIERSASSQSKIYVGNLPFDASEDRLSELFGRFGTVISIRMIVEPHTGQSRGFAFVQMDAVDAEVAVAKLNGWEFGGRPLKVNLATPEGARWRGAGGYRPEPASPPKPPLEHGQAGHHAEPRRGLPKARGDLANADGRQPPSPASAPASGGLLGGLLGGDAADSGELQPRPGPPPPEQPRYMNAAIADHPKDAPLDIDKTYVLELGVDVERSGDASTRVPATGMLFEKHEQEIELTVQVVSDDFEVAQGPTPLSLPRQGPSQGKARFNVKPKREGRCTLTATIHKSGNFLMQMEVSYSVGNVGARPADAVTHGRPIAAASHLTPRELGLAIRPAAGGGYDCTVWGAVHTRVTLRITEDELTDAINATRDALMSVITQRDHTGRLVFQTAIVIDENSQQAALNTLARAGAALFQRIFFGPTSDPGVKAVGEFLRKRAAQPGQRLKLQIVAERFPIPWGLLYVGKIARNAPLDWNLFLGMRHIIEQIPLQTDLAVDDAVIKSDDPSLAVSVNFHAGIDAQMRADFVASQQKFWRGSSSAFGQRMPVEERLTRKQLLEALTNSAPDKLMYLYCHAVTSKPDDPGGIHASHLVLTGEERLTLGDLNLEAPTTEPLPGQPLIFINACESAELMPSFYDGFVPYFMSKGARGVVGTECKTPALFAAEWASRFFPRFLAGEPLGELFLDLRQEFCADGNPLGLLYAVYCDGDTQIRPGLQ